MVQLFEDLNRLECALIAANEINSFDFISFETYKNQVREHLYKSAEEIKKRDE